MSEQDRPGPPDDEPLIGGTSSGTPPPAGGSPSPPSRDPGEGGRVIGVPPDPEPRTVDPWESQHLRRSTPDLRTYGRDGPRAGYYGATRRSLGRTAAAYFFTIAALVIGGILIFLLFRVLNDNGDEPPVEPTVVAVTPEARIETPSPGQRLTVDEELTVIVSVVSGEDIVRFELLITGITKDQVFTSRVTAENTYAAVLTARFEAAGVYDLVVLAYTAGGDEIQTDPIQVVVVPSPEETPEPSTTALVVGVTELRTGPSGEYNQAGTLEPGQVITVTGRTRDQQWLQLENGLWVRLNAVDIDPGDLADLPDVDAPPPPSPTPTPPPTPVDTGDSEGNGDGEPETTTTATATPTSTAPLNAPDFIPTNAVLLDRGATLRVTITNTSTNSFSGAIVVRVEEVPDDPDEVATPIELAENLSMEPNDTAALNFTIDPPVTEQITVRVTVDPDDAVAESSEDNNQVDFIVVPPFAGPDLSLAAVVSGDVLRVTIANAGDPLSTNDARLVISVPGETTTRTISPLAIGEGESVEIDDIAVPQTGEAIRITLFIDGVNEGSTSVPNPNVVDIPPETPTPDTGEESGVEGPEEPDLGDGS
ncbi:MAG: hypothetical protein F4X89_10485 [Dehalococcoidia bacterium]|nr:hypothetical protein [Dehalococcoidia bacterium]